MEEGDGLIFWKDVLKPISVYVQTDCTIEDVIKLFTTQNAEIVFVKAKDTLVGYCTVELLLKQLAQSKCMSEPIKYKNDILKVPQGLPVEFFHNVSLIIGVDKDDSIIGYTTMEQAQHQIAQLEMKDLNFLLHGAGVGIIRTNADYEIEFMNETAENILGLPSSFLLFRNYKILLTMEKNLDAVKKGEILVNVSASLNFKQTIGNFYPLKIDGEITGLIHIFFLKEVFEESVQELDFVRHLYSDLQAVYASSQEQILVINESGKIIRIAGTFLSNFWGANTPNEIIGKNIIEFVHRDIFQPNVFELCKKQMKKVTAIQESSGNTRIWSIATPVYHEGHLEKIIILSRDITSEKTATPLRREENEHHTPDQYAAANANEKPIVYRSKKIENLIASINRVAQFNSTILLEGESGVGKEMFAHLIHTVSPRRYQKLVRINCGAIPENLIESELFGYEKGAFTGADKNGKAGLFEIANNGTLFLDEIAELPFNMQVKLLRVIQEQEVTRIGGLRPIPVNVRIISATNKNLKEMVNSGEFREDLYYRLNVIPFRIPSLRERKEDILPLSINFSQNFNERYGIKKSFTPEAIEVLESYEWPGNVRELQNIVERLTLLCQDEWIYREDVITVLYGDAKEKRKNLYLLDLMPMKEAVEELEKQLIERGIKKYQTADKLSKVLGVSPATISRRMKKLQP